MAGFTVFNASGSIKMSGAIIDLTIDVTGVLPAANGGTGQSSYAVGDLLYASGATTLSKLADVAAGSYLRSGGVVTAPVWSTITLPNAATLGDIWYASATSVITALAKDTNSTRYLSNTGASNIPAWAQVALATGVSGTLPIANGGTGQTTAGPAQGVLNAEFTTTTTGNIDDLNFSNASLIRMNNATLSTIRGLVAGTAGQRVTIVSVGAGQVNLSHQDTNDGTAANRLINIAVSAATSLAAGSGAAVYQYDATTARWRLVAHKQGAWITPTFAAGDFTAINALTWTVEAGDVQAYAYCLEGRVLHVVFTLTTTSVGGTPDNTVYIAVPGGYGVTKLVNNAGLRINNSGVEGVGVVSASGNQLSCLNYPAFGNWAASTNNTIVAGSFTFEVD
jgi:hypothetical protein